MTKEQAETIVDGWVKDWRVYLDGGLHKLARAALIERLSTDEEKPRRGRPPNKSAPTVTGIGG